MANIVTVEANALLDASLGTEAHTAVTTPMKLRLLTSNGSASASGTPVNGGSYADQTVEFDPASNGSTSNDGSVSFTGMPACTVTGIEIWDSSTNPRRMWFGELDESKTVGNGDTVTFASGAITIQLS